MHCLNMTDIEVTSNPSSVHQEWPRRSLIDDARMDSVLNQSFEVHVLDEDEENLVTSNFLIKLAPGIGMAEVLNRIKGLSHELVHLEPRKSISPNGVYRTKVDLLLVFNASRKVSSLMKKKIETMTGCESVTVVDETEDVKVENKEIWFPTHISELDECQHLMLKFQPELATDHPGFHDEVYKVRRHLLASHAFEHRHGKPIPRIEYTDEELITWSTAYKTLKGMYTKMACKEHIKAFQVLEDNGIYSPDKVPQLEDVSNFLRKQSGFQLRPVAGLLSARDFLASLAFRVFQCTQYIRHPSKPLHTAEPDCIHELLGHVPMLTDLEFAEFSQEIGLASIGVSDADIEKIATLYWFTVEFGLCMEGDEVRAYGAGLLSAFGELQHALSDVPDRKPFDPNVTALTRYTDEDYQPLYFVADSVKNMKAQLREYTKKLERPFEVTYNPYTERLEILRDQKGVERVVRGIENELYLIRKVLTKINIE